MIAARLAGAALVAAAGAGCAGLRTAVPPAGPAQPPETYQLSGASVAIDDPAGEVRVQSGTGPDVRVTVTRFGTDADLLRVERTSGPGGERLRIAVQGPASRRLLYPRLPGRSDSVQFRATGSGYAPGRGGFLGLFGGRAIKLVRRPGAVRATEAHADLVVAVPPGHRVDLHVGAGDVHVTGDVGDLHLQSIAGAFNLDTAAGRIFVSSNSGSVFVRGGSGELSVTSRAASVDMAGFTGTRLEATTGAGTLRGDALAAGVLRLRAGAGGIDLSGVRGTTLDLRSGSGRVAARDVVADTLRAASGIGDLSFASLRVGSATLQARKGNVLAALAVVPSALRVNADGGVVLRLPRGAGAELALSSEHGRVTIEGEDPAGTASPAVGGGASARAGRSLVTRLGAGGGRIEVRAEHDILLRLGPFPSAEATR